MTQTSAVASPAVWEIPGRSQAEEALAVAYTSGRRSFYKAAVFLPDHVPDFIEEGRFDKNQQPKADVFFGALEDIRN